MRGRRKPLEPRNGRKVGDSGTTSTLFPGSAGILPAVVGKARTGVATSAQITAPVLRTRASMTKSNHGLRGGSLLPTGVVYSTYVQNFFQTSLNRQPNSTEQSYWNDIMRAAIAHSQGSPALAVREMGKTLFESTEYGARGQTNHYFVRDLYETYLLRDPDSGGWSYWESVVPSIGRENVRHAFDECG
jgi:hypothetical protein